MHTVLRFNLQTAVADEIPFVTIANRLHQKLPAMFEDLDGERSARGFPDRRDSMRFSLSLCDDKDWWVHRQSLLNFMDQCKDEIQWANDEGMDVRFDLCIDREDYSSRILTSVLLDQELVQAFATTKISFEFSIFFIEEAG